MSVKRFLGLFLLFIFFLVATTPARWVVQTFMPENADIRLSGITGSVWSGHAESVAIQRQSIKDVSWTINPLVLITGGIGGSVDIQDKVIQADGSWKAGFDQSFSVSDFSIAASAAKLSPMLPLQGASLNGNIKANFDSLSIAQETGLSDVTGSLDWTKAKVNANGQNLDLGHFKLNLATNDKGQVVANIAKTRNVLDAKGTITLDWPKSAKLDISVKEEQQGMLRQAVSFMKKDTEAGRRKLDMTVPLNMR